MLQLLFQATELEPSFYLNEMSESVQVRMRFEFGSIVGTVGERRRMPQNAVAGSQSERIEQVYRTRCQICNGAYKVSRQIRIRFFPIGVVFTLCFRRRRCRIRRRTSDAGRRAADKRSFS